MGRWSFWSQFDRNRSIIGEDIRPETIFTFRPQFCSPSYAWPALCFHWIRSFCGFPVWIKSDADGRTDGVQYLRRSPREGRVLMCSNNSDRRWWPLPFPGAFHSFSVSSCCLFLFNACMANKFFFFLQYRMTGRKWGCSKPSWWLVTAQMFRQKSSVMCRAVANSERSQDDRDSGTLGRRQLGAG